MLWPKYHLSVAWCGNANRQNRVEGGMKMRNKLAITSIGLCVCFGAAAGETWYVNGALATSGDGKSWETAFKRIQEGIDAAQYWGVDSVIVAEGIYVENIRFKGKRIVLRSTDPLNPAVVANTIIDGNKAGSVVSFSSGETEHCVLSGFTIRNGAAYKGGGINGGGDYGSEATIENNVICDNSADFGGGLYGLTGTVRRNVITRNWARVDGGGFFRCKALIQNNRIVGNSTDFMGGGLADCDGAIENNTIAGNRAGEEGGGLFECYGPVLNCIIWGNSAPHGNQIYAYGATTQTYCCIEGWTGGGEGNMALYPYFVDASGGDYHLRSWSPCIDAGDPSSPFSKEPQPNGNRIDIGAYGNTPEATPRSPDTDLDGLPDTWEVQFLGDLSQGASDDPDGDLIPNLREYYQGLNPTVRETWYVDASVSSPGDGTSWDSAFKTIQDGINEAADGDIVVVAEGTYLENIEFRGKNIKLTSTDPLDPAVVAKTIIDGSHSGPVVTFSGTEEENCIISGFTIRNGKASVGGGICGDSGEGPTHAKIENNIVVENTADDGGGVALCDGTIQNNTITRNSAGLAGGGLFYCWESSIQNNLIVSNSAGDRGGGLVSCSGIIQNNTIVGNSASRGGGLEWCRGTIRNCIIWGNTASEEAQLLDCPPPSYSCIQGWTEGGRGNTPEDPGFVGPTLGDYRLAEGSPCINKGANYYWFVWPQRDIDGNCRLAGSRVDIGCHEYGSSPDSDGDLLSDLDEVAVKTDPSMPDTDGDRLKDGLEVLRGSDPTGTTLPGVIQVPSAIPAVQAALCVALAGDETIVAPGVYEENLLFPGVDVVLRGSQPDDPTTVASTILDGGGAGSVVSFTGRESEACLLSGFTIRNGKAISGGGICGGRPRNLYTRATIEKNAITGNTAQGQEPWALGGGVALCDGVIQNNVISGNSSGGLYGCGGIIQNNLISKNLADFDGGGLLWCGAIIQNNWIAGNSAAHDGAGLAYCSGTIRSNWITGNYITGQYGSGAGLRECNATITNNTITRNSGARAGGGLSLCDRTITNCIIWGNVAEESPQLSFSSTPTYSCIEGWTGGGEGNTTDDPKFIDPDGPDDDPTTWQDNDYHLGAGSPCIDVGKNEKWMWDALDVDGNSRIIPGASSWTVDMGACEHVSPVYRLMVIIGLGEHGIDVRWTSEPGGTYTIYSCENLLAGVWSKEATVVSDKPATSWTEPDKTCARKFYRIEAVLPIEPE